MLIRIFSSVSTLHPDAKKKATRGSRACPSLLVLTRFLAGKTIKKVIIVPKRMINLIVG